MRLGRFRSLLHGLSLAIPLIVISNQLVHGADAPWGFAWSQQRDSLPPPSFVRPDGNVKLIYEGPSLPAQMPDTEIVLLFVCELYGLQQVRWVSRAFSRQTAIEKFLDIYDEGVKRHGNADEGDVDRGTAA